MSNVVLGVNAYHGDASVALFIDGACRSAVEEERFSRVKHQSGFPVESVRWCLDEAGLSPANIDHVAIGRSPASNLINKIGYALRRPPSYRFLKSRLRNAAKVLDVKQSLATALGTTTKDIPAQFHRVEHHRTHIASAYDPSPFEEAATISLDGMGDFISTMWGHGRDRGIRIAGDVKHPHSLGHFYQAVTQFLGLHRYGDEFKLMGLASYGSPCFKEQLQDVIHLEDGLQFRLNLDYFTHHLKGNDMTWEEGTPEVGSMWSPKMAEVFGPAREVGAEITARDEDLAASVQAVLEDIGLEMLRRLQHQTGSKNLAMAGGVALNCVMNGRIREETPFEEVWIQPAANDAGISLGAALWTNHQVLGLPRTWVMEHAYLGNEFEDQDYKRALEAAGVTYRFIAEHELFDHVAGRISDGAVTGWFQGRMEFGPRALGNRSIVCDPRRGDMKDILNSRIKHREPFRPFAPSILVEKTGEWFEDSYPSPYMLLAYEVRPEKREQIPAVTHVDGTGRLQTVNRVDNPRYYDLISAFQKKTGVPVLLNTSFNENEPICCRPQEAVDVFQRTKMDVLVLGSYVAEKSEQAS